MAMTLQLLEQYVTSEVENLHFRVDQLTLRLDAIENRLEVVERQLGVLYLAVEDLKVEVADIKKNMLTGQDVVDIIAETVPAIVVAIVAPLLEKQTSLIVKQVLAALR